MDAGDPKSLSQSSCEHETQGVMTDIGDIMQEILTEKKRQYSYGSYNKSNDTEQWIRITEGCPHNCAYCYEPQEIKVFDVPEIVRNKVKIMDMNILVPQKDPSKLLSLLPRTLKGRFVRYEFICGIDYRFLNQQIADQMKLKHFERVRIAWDWWYKDQLKIKDGLNLLYNAGYKPEDIIIFMICNWNIPYDECVKKTDLCKVWNVRIADCYYDNQTNIFKKFIPIGWTTKEAHSFRKSIRKHNQLVNFKCDPEIHKRR